MSQCCTTYRMADKRPFFITVHANQQGDRTKTYNKAHWQEEKNNKGEGGGCAGNDRCYNAKLLTNRVRQDEDRNMDVDATQ